MGNYATFNKAQLSTDCQPPLPRPKHTYNALIRLQAEQLMQMLSPVCCPLSSLFISSLSLSPFSHASLFRLNYKHHLFDDYFNRIIHIVLQFVFSRNFLCIAAGKCMR